MSVESGLKNIICMKKFKTIIALFSMTGAVGVVSVITSFGSGNNAERPNILWITCEDISPWLGSYGCREAYTPNLDRLAENGIRYNHMYANAPVCAVARSTILSGMYASTIGTHQMRSRTQLQEIIPVYPKILREAGYYCTNNVKKDYNSNYQNDNTLWDESSDTAHYRNRKPGQPFFAVFNNRDHGYIMLHGLNVFQYSHTDIRLTREDWERFENKRYADGDEGSGLGYPQRIISDALELWPGKRLVE